MGFHPAFCQKLEDRNSHQSYGVLKLIENSVEFISTSANLKNLSNEEKGILDEIENHLPKYINPVVLNLVAEVASNKCFQNLKYVFENVQSEWAKKMLDSYGKPESGILLGNFKWLGEYDECLGVYAPPKANTSLGNFHGKYCTLVVPLKLQNMTLLLSTALCLPDSCNPDVTFLGDIMQKFNLSDVDEETESVFGNATLTCKPTSRKLTTGAIVMMCFLSIIVLLVAAGSSITAFEYCMKENVSKETVYAVNTTGKSLIDADRENGTRGTSDDVYLSGTKNKITLPAWLEKCKPFFNCFCIFTNGQKLLNVSSSEGQLPCLHGIRFLTMAWIILCHTYLSACATSITLPPTTAAAREHSLRAYLQVQLWSGSAKSPLDWGWKQIKHGLFSVTTHKEPAPPALLSVISCKCAKGCDEDLTKNVDATGERSVCSLVHRDYVCYPSATKRSGTV
ncbi:hypothetical protein AVEN_144533-1 [Araneus ventricosus]|uniref:Nose resistant-to-fluoxetine protein N-terminal domain-containing protein n=1 Tax=Araneus ventricosus TaxID=182803 RepID=A0A4Y2IT38_ARAVE|nr:hypothetical protein AVEN_144533-1 [Araneus ventricosus]